MTLQEKTMDTQAVRPGGSAAPLPGPSEPALTLAGERDAIPERTATIASISGQDWYIGRTYGTFHIPACPKGQASALLIVSQRGDALDLGDGRKFPFTISAREIADDLVQDLGDHGVFVCAGPRPTAEELAAAGARREAWYKQLVFEGDQIWARSHNHREVSDLHRRAVLGLGLEREWAYVPQKMVDCPVCGEKIKPAVALCRHCGAVLDREKAARHGVAPAVLPPASILAGRSGAESPSPRAEGPKK
jgi:hypothetical protein